MRRSKQNNLGFNLAVGGKIIEQKSKSKLITISTNVEYYRKWALYIFLIGIAISLWFLNIAAGDFGWFYVLFVSCPFILLGVIALGTYYKSKSKVNVIIDLSKKTIGSVSNGSIPFNQVSAFFMTRLPTVNHKGVITYYSYQLHVRFINNQERFLINSDHIREIEQAGKFLSLKTKIDFLYEDLDG